MSSNASMPMLQPFSPLTPTPSAARIFASPPTASLPLAAPLPLPLPLFQPPASPAFPAFPAFPASPASASAPTSNASASVSTALPTGQPLFQQAAVARAVALASRSSGAGDAALFDGIARLLQQPTPTSPLPASPAKTAKLPLASVNVFGASPLVAAAAQRGVAGAYDLDGEIPREILRAAMPR